MHETQIKKLIGEKATSFVEHNMIVGLGTGTTAAAFIESLAERLLIEKLDITCVATSQASENLAVSLGIRCVPIDAVHEIDITFDGADEIDTQKRMIKGAGGALLREKILAHSSGKLVVMIEAKKQVEFLGKAKLPVEVLPFGHHFTKASLVHFGYELELRKNTDGSPFITDNHNYIYDIHFSSLRKNPEEDERCIRAVPGVLETGFFFNLAGPVIIGKQDGSLSVLE